MYVRQNPPTKKALRQLVKDGLTKRNIFQYNNIFGKYPPENGVVYVEGPHYPLSHSWYAALTIENGIVVEVE